MFSQTPLFTVDVSLYQNWTPSFRTLAKSLGRVDLFWNNPTTETPYCHCQSPSLNGTRSTVSATPPTISMHPPQTPSPPHYTPCFPYYLHIPTIVRTPTLSNIPPPPHPTQVLFFSTISQLSTSNYICMIVLFTTWTAMLYWMDLQTRAKGEKRLDENICILCLWCYSECASTPDKLKSVPDHGGNWTRWPLGY